MTFPSFTLLLPGCVRFCTMHFPVHKGKDQLVHALRHRLSRPEERLVVQNRAGLLMELDIRDHIQRIIYFFGYYETPVADFLLNLLRPGMVFVDIGSHVGQYALLAARAVGPEGAVFAFEPEPLNFNKLKRNVDLNWFTNIDARSVALADYNGETTFYLASCSPADANYGVHSLRRKPEWNESHEICVEVETLDRALEGVARMDVIKLDVERAELLVPRGARKSLEKFKPTLIFEAEEKNTGNFGYSTTDLKRFACEAGYTCFRLPFGRGAGKLNLASAEANGVEEKSMIVAMPQAR